MVSPPLSEDRATLSYVEYPADPCMRPPGHLSGVTFHALALAASRARLQALLDRQLNTPADGAVSYEALSRYVLLVGASVDRLVSGAPERGAIRYRDVALWVPARARDADGARVVLFAPYIFVDDAHTMVTGRELFGLPKQFGRLEVPPGTRDPLRITTDVFGVRASAGCDAPALELQRLWDVTGTEGPTPPRDVDGPGALGELARALRDHDALELRELLRPEALTPARVVGLQQLRDAADPGRAAYQAIVEAPITLERLRDVCPRRRAAELIFTLHPLASHPVARDLGLRVGPQRACAALSFRADVRMDAGRVVWQARPARRDAPLRAAPRRRRVAILGGGISALTAALELSEPGREPLDITVYVNGWRLGGKGASGRDLARGARIEEHGLHVWYGFYENAFRVIRRVYDELGRDPAAPLASWRDAFTPQSYVVLNERYKGEWVRWRLPFPRNTLSPGDGESLPGLWTSVETLCGCLAGLLDERARARIGAAPRRGDDGANPLSAIARAVARVGAPGTWAALRMLIHLTRRLAARGRAGGREGGREGGRDDDRASQRALARRLARARDRLWPSFRARLDDDDARALWELLDVATTIVIGVIEDDLVRRGFTSIDDLDLREWLLRHGAKPHPTVHESPAVRFIYNAGFSFKGGDEARPAFAAGAALRGALRMLLTYKGAVVWKMTSGMGDVIFAPLYEVLRRRGVRFEFFHHVERLELTRDRREVEAVHVTRQASAPRPYEPLVDVNGLPCWPSEPRYEQLEDGEQLRAALAAAETDLEHVGAPPAPYQGARPRALRRGEDFDELVLGIPVGALGSICGELRDADPRWGAMLDGVGTVATQAYQLWLRRDLAGLGWREPSPILGTYVDPVDTYCDMTHTRWSERWARPDEVRHIAYFCGVMSEGPERGEPLAAATRRVGEAARAHYARVCEDLWPALAREGERARWDALHDPEGREGAARFDAQYWRANTTGAHRYVQALPGTTKLRLRADDSGLDNLVLTGDWIDNGLNCGCIEASVMSGMQAARALIDAPIAIAAETDAWLARLLGLDASAPTTRAPARRRRARPPAPASSGRRRASGAR